MLKFLNVKKGIYLGLVIFLAASCGVKTKPSTLDPIPSAVQQIQVRHKVEGVDRGDQLFNFYENENKTALDLLKSGHNVETKSFSGVGEFVESINGVKADGKKEFWAFYLNGQQAQVGASDYKPKNGDVIEWKVEKIK